MKYKSLLTLFHEGKTDEYKSRIKNAPNDSAFYTVGLDISGNPGYFIITQDIQKAIIDIINLSHKLQQKGLSDVDFQAAKRRYLIDEIVDTNGIEGVISTHKDVTDILTHRVKNDRLESIVSKYDMMNDTEMPIKSTADIRGIYDSLVANEVSANDPDNIPDGVIFRKGGVDVLNAGGKSIHKGLFPESKIIDAMERSLMFLSNKDIEILVRIAVFHYLFGYIHPFYDGNGRTSRFISSYLLSREVSPLLGYRLAHTIRGKLSAYYNAFKVVDNPLNMGDITPFLDMFIQMVHNAISDVAEDVLGS
jgi:Fic family protein